MVMDLHTAHITVSRRFTILLWGEILMITIIIIITFFHAGFFDQQRLLRTGGQPALHSTLRSLRADHNKLKGIASPLFITRLMLFYIEHAVFINSRPLKYVFNTTCVLLHNQCLAILLNNMQYSIPW